MNTREYLLFNWNFSPLVVGVCLLAALLYGMRLNFRFQARAWYFVAALVTFFLAVASPIASLANGYLFSAHMLQHMMLLLIVPLFLMLSLPPTETPRWRVPALISWAGGVGAMWIWHQQTMCAIATTTPAGHAIQVVSLVALGALFWRPVFGPRTSQRISPLAGVVYLFGACITCSLLGILITFAPTGAACPVYMHPSEANGVLNMIRNNWGMTFAKDQQIGGLLMWVPGCGIYLGTVMAMFARWYRPTEISPVGSHVTQIRGR